MWQKVYENTLEVRASIVQGILAEHEISAVIVNKKDSAYQVFGSYEVHVSKDDVLKAIKIIEEEIKFE